MFEDTIQNRLTKLWCRKGLTFRGERLFLAAWEVMTNWGINDGSKDFRHPSVDFLFCDQHGKLWAMEVKVAVRSPLGNLAAAFYETRLGIHGRVCCPPKDDFRRMHRSFFRLTKALSAEPFGKGEIRRIVGATDFGPDWYPIFRSFNYGRQSKLARQIHRDYETENGSNLELRRFVKLSCEERESLSKPVLYLNLNEELDRYRRWRLRQTASA
jgi:hypothetical protein